MPSEIQIERKCDDVNYRRYIKMKWRAQLAKAKASDSRESSLKKCSYLLYPIAERVGWRRTEPKRESTKRRQRWLCWWLSVSAALRTQQQQASEQRQKRHVTWDYTESPTHMDPRTQLREQQGGLSGDKRTDGRNDDGENRRRIGQKSSGAHTQSWTKMISIYQCPNVHTHRCDH